MKNSLNVSNSLTTLASAPDFFEPVSRRMFNILSNINRDILWSAFLLARSTNWARNVLIINSKDIAINTPIVRAISDSIASLGTTRSYTTMINIELDNPRKFVNVAAIIT